MVFSLIPPKKDPGVEVENYVTPFFTDSFNINSETGELTWQMPMFNGAYNIAILIQEFRKGVPIGFVGRVYCRDCYKTCCSVIFIKLVCCSGPGRYCIK